MNQILISCYSSNFDRYDHLHKCVSLSGDVGVELAIITDRPGFIENLQAQKQRLKEPVAFHGPHEEVEAASPLGSAEQNKILSAYRLSFELCDEFNARYIVTHTNQISFEARQRKELQACSIETIRLLYNMSKSSSAVLLVENVGDVNEGSELFEQEDFILLFDKIPEAFCLFDVGHALVNRWDIEKVIKALSDKIRAYHLHSNNCDCDSHLPLFEGALSIPLLMRCIIRYTPDADLVLEYAPAEHITPSLISRDVAKLRTLLAQYVPSQQKG